MPKHSHDISGPGDRYEALAEVLEKQATQSARDRERELAEARRRSRKGAPWGVLAVLAVITAWLWLFPPPFLRVDPPPPPPVAEEEAALRFTMYLQAQRIAAHRERTGRLPDRLEEAGPPLPAMEYVRLGDGLYQLTGATDRLRLTYRSDLPLGEFVGSGADVIDEAGL